MCFRQNIKLHGPHIDILAFLYFFLWKLSLNSKNLLYAWTLWLNTTFKCLKPKYHKFHTHAFLIVNYCCWNGSSFSTRHILSLGWDIFTFFLGWEGLSNSVKLRKWRIREAQFSWKQNNVNGQENPKFRGCKSNFIRLFTSWLVPPIYIYILYNHVSIQPSIRPWFYTTMVLYYHGSIRPWLYMTMVLYDHDSIRPWVITFCRFVLWWGLFSDTCPDHDHASE